MSHTRAISRPLIPSAIDVDRRQNPFVIWINGPRNPAVETRLDDCGLPAERKPFDREARDHGAEAVDAAAQIVADSRCVVLDHRHCRKLAAQNGGKARLALDGDDALGGAAGGDQTAGQNAGSGAQFENRTRPRQIDKAGHLGGEPGAARIGGGDLERALQPEPEEDAEIGGHALPLRRRPMPALYPRYVTVFSEPDIGIRKTVIRVCYSGLGQQTGGRDDCAK